MTALGQLSPFSLEPESFDPRTNSEPPARKVLPSYLLTYLIPLLSKIWTTKLFFLFISILEGSLSSVHELSRNPLPR